MATPEQEEEQRLHLDSWLACTFCGDRSTATEANSACHAARWSASSGWRAPAMCSSRMRRRLDRNDGRRNSSTTAWAASSGVGRWCHRGVESVDGEPAGGVQQLGLVGEVVVDRGGCHPRPCRDIGECHGVEADLDAGIRGCFEQTVACRRIVGLPRSTPGSGQRRSNPTARPR